MIESDDDIHARLAPVADRLEEIAPGSRVTLPDGSTGTVDRISFTDALVALDERDATGSLVTWAALRTLKPAL